MTPATTKASRKRKATKTALKPDPRARQGKVGKAFASAVGSITPFLWFNGDFQQAAKFYVSLFPGSSIDSVHAMGGSMTLAGQRFMVLNGGPHYKLTPAYSMFVVCKDQKEVDRLWNAFAKEGRPSRCGWIDDKFGLTWQIVPQAFLDLTSGPPKKTQAVFQAMMGMEKFIVKDLQTAYDNA